MHAPQAPSTNGKTHPLLILAALAVILFCGVGTAAIMGWLPSSKGRTPAGDPSQATPVALAAGPQQPGAAAQPYPAQPYPARPTTGAYAPATPLTTAPLPSAEPATIAPTTASTATGYASNSASGQAEPARARHPKASAAASRAAREESGSNWCANCGNIESVRTITTRAQGSGIGAAGGAILGGLLGSQVGGGHGRQLATVAGAVGGAVAGNQVEGNMKASRSYEIRVRLDDGSLRTFHQQSAPQWRTGDRVRIVKGSLRPA